MSEVAHGADQNVAAPLGDVLAAALETDRLLAERAERLDAGDWAAAGDLAALLPERLALVVSALKSMEDWVPSPDLALAGREAVNALAFQALRWRMMQDSLERANSGDMPGAFERRAASHHAFLDQQRSWQVLGFALQCVEAQQPASVAHLALPDDVRAALGLLPTPHVAPVSSSAGLAAARLTIAAVPPRQVPGREAPRGEPQTLSTAAGAAAEALLRRLPAEQAASEWRDEAREEYLAIVRRAMRSLVEAPEGGQNLLSRLATAVAGRPIDFGGATADGFGVGQGLLWGTIELDISLPRGNNEWWAMTDDERAEFLIRLRRALGWVAVGADAVVQPNVLTALDFPDALRAGAGSTWQERVAPEPIADSADAVPRIEAELAAIAQERDDALDAWSNRMRAGWKSSMM